MSVVPLALSDLEAQVRELIGAMIFDRTFAPAGSMAWADAAINWACDMTCKIMGLTRVTAGPLTVSNNKVAIPSDAIKVVTCVSGSLGMGKVLFESTMQIEDQKNVNWKGNTGPALAWIQQDGATILLNGTATAILVGYIQIPTPMVDPGDSPDSRIPIEFHQYLKYGAAAYLLQLTTQAKNLDLAAKHFASFGTGLGVGPIPLAAISVNR